MASEQCYKEEEGGGFEWMGGTKDMSGLGLLVTNMLEVTLDNTLGLSWNRGEMQPLLCFFVFFSSITHSSLSIPHWGHGRPGHREEESRNKALLKLTHPL